MRGGEMDEQIIIPPRRFRAQDRYAQQTLDYLWEHVDELCEATPDGIFYQGSLHMLVGKINHAAQKGEVVNILRESGAIRHVGQSMWQLIRKEVFFDPQGNPVDFDAPTYGQDTQKRMTERNFQVLNQRVIALEDGMAKLTEVVVKLIQERNVGNAVGTSTEGTPLDVEQQDTGE